MIIPTLAATLPDETSFVDLLPLVGAILALTGAVGVAAWNQYQNRRDRRRDLYSEAYRPVVAWAELPYRVRRRNPATPYELVELFHALQEAIDYHDGWISIESADLARSYRRFVMDVKSKTGPAIQRAWAESPCDPHNGFTPPSGEDPPDVEAEKRRFLADVNDHLSLSPKRRHELSRRYPASPRSTT